ncbi:hypothetical protein G9C98_008476 [Cotesia typhae]|uniref:Peptidase S1 domain-containing protein n=1 Tax=Cotesia typhae TaxID=2053667 RepID=A0A8J5QKT0_9HYME|nr:hypothetical protein G9C98_008476 [Cotesia typhae]
MINYPALIIGLAGLALVISARPNDLPRDLSDGRIVGGEDVEIENVPYQVSVLVRGRHECGGSILSDYWVLTAAHCTQFAQRMYSVRAGTVWKNQGGTIYKVDKVVNHEDYQLILNVPINDIALLRLATPFVFGEACQPIDLPNKGEKIKPETQTVVTGWGETKSSLYSGRLQMVVIPTISIESCREAYGFTKIPDEGSICAMTPDGDKDACQGDSGGPMVVDKRLVGITTFSEQQQKVIDCIGRRKMFKYRQVLLIATILAVGLVNAIQWFPMMNPLTPNGRIVGGEPTDIKEVPHQVSLQAYGFAFCGGTIVAEDWVLTAAHCAVYSESTMTVRAGTTTKGSGGTVHKVTKIITHEDFSTNRYGIPINDVALIKLATPFEVDEFRQPIELFEFKEEAVEGIQSTITGWGATVEGGSTPEVLNTVDVPIISKSECHDAYISFGGLPKGQICAAYPEGGKDACQGDSGGPLTIYGRLAGIVSWGNGCARPGYPGVYTEVASFRDWIDIKISTM